jgi:hypothetical protein
MKKTTVIQRRLRAVLGLTLFLIPAASRALFGQSLDFPSKRWGISIGNSKEFNGLRINFSDSRVYRINGINVTLWKPMKDNEDAVVQGLSLGIIPGAGYLRGIQLGLLGVAGERELTGVSIGLLGVGSGGDVTGINLGGLGAGSGGSMTGVNIGGFGVGAGENLTGINIGIFGVGAGENMKGINIGGFGVGAGEDAMWVNIGIFGAGAGRDMKGINIGGFGIGAGRDMKGINIGGFGVGAGEKLIGLTIGGVGAGAPEVQGITIGGIGIGGETLKGIHLALGTVMVTNNGRMVGFSASAFNHFKGTQHGLAIGIVNYAYRLKGVQIGLINIVRDNPRGMKVLPILNANF